MAGHFDCVGFSLGSQDDYADLIIGVATEAPSTALSDGGRLVLWEDPSGAMLAIAITAEGRIDCAKPAFAATHSLPVVPRGMVTFDECPHCHPVEVEVIDASDPSSEMLYPLFTEVPDTAIVRESLGVGQPARLALAAFGEKVSVFPDKAAYEGQDPKPVMSDRSFIPSGMFHPDPTKERPPRAEALIAGRVTDAEVRTNTRSGDTFVRASLDTYGGTIDALLGIADAGGAAPPPGAIVQGTFWLVGRLLPSR